MIKIGLTGGIGAGKSLVAQLFGLLDIPIFYADLAAKYLMVNDSVLKLKVSELLGAESYLEDGSLNKPHIGQKIFSDDALLKALNALTHPAVNQATKEWFTWQKSPYAISESALIFESGHQQSFDRIISVSAPEALRIDRVMKRDKISRDQVKARMLKQWEQERKDEAADHIIYNDGQQLLIPQVLEIHRTLVAS